VESLDRHKNNEVSGYSISSTATLLAQGKTQGSTLQQCTNKTLTIGPLGNTCEADEVSSEVEVGVVVGLKCLQPSWDKIL
jgi:hypothetical protein